jgi:hypothetical protein
MEVDDPAIGGMDLLLEELERRYVFDTMGRMIESRCDGVLPQFVLGRSAEGCLWRFRADLPAESVNRIARLAAREPGLPMGVEGPIPQPERLVMIERLFSPIEFENVVDVDRRAEVESRRTQMTRNGVVVAELFSID